MGLIDTIATEERLAELNVQLDKLSELEEVTKAGIRAGLLPEKELEKVMERRNKLMAIKREFFPGR